MKRCERCGNRVFLERTLDGDEYVCLACGDRRPEVAVKPLDIPGRQLLEVYENRKRGPKTQGIRL